MVTVSSSIQLTSTKTFSNQTGTGQTLTTNCSQSTSVHSKSLMLRVMSFHTTQQKVSGQTQNSGQSTENTTAVKLTSQQCSQTATEYSLSGHRSQVVARQCTSTVQSTTSDYSAKFHTTVVTHGIRHSRSSPTS